MTAAVIAVAISYWGDAIGHIVQWSDGNDAVSNVWAIPSDVLQPLPGIQLLLACRRGLGRPPTLPKRAVMGA